VVAESTIGRHVTQLGLAGLRVPFTANSLFIAARHMTQLCELSPALKLRPKSGPLTFPPALQKLHLHFNGEPAAADLNEAIKAVSRLPLLESFTIQLNSIVDQMSFASLASLPQLRHLASHAPNRASLLSDTQVAELRALPRLHQLDVWPMPTSLLRRLLAQPHQLQWQEMTLPEVLDDEAAALLPQLPSLTKIDVFLDAQRFDWLPQLPNLIRADIEVSRSDDEDRAPMDSLVAALQRCTKIEYLKLLRSDLRAAHLADLLPRLPRLRILKLKDTDIDSLSFLSQAPTTQHLSCLVLSSCNELPVAELRHVHSLRGLKTLILHRSFSAPLDDHSRWLLTPPSLTLPKLEKFAYTAP
jgi:hypothetical protein